MPHLWDHAVTYNILYRSSSPPLCRTGFFASVSFIDSVKQQTSVVVTPYGRQINTLAYPYSCRKWIFTKCVILFLSLCCSTISKFPLNVIEPYSMPLREKWSSIKCNLSGRKTLTREVGLQYSRTVGMSKVKYTETLWLRLPARKCTFGNFGVLFLCLGAVSETKKKKNPDTVAAPGCIGVSRAIKV